MSNTENNIKNASHTAKNAAQALQDVSTAGETGMKDLWHEAESRKVKRLSADLNAIADRLDEIANKQLDI